MKPFSKYIFLEVIHTYPNFYNLNNTLHIDICIFLVHRQKKPIAGLKTIGISELSELLGKGRIWQFSRASSTSSTTVKLEYLLNLILISLSVKWEEINKCFKNAAT